MASQRIEGSDPEYLVISWASSLVAEQRALMGEHYWAYNIEDNRHSIEAMLLFAYQQGLTPTKLECDSLFVPEAAGSAPRNRDTCRQGGHSGLQSCRDKRLHCVRETKAASTAHGSRHCAKDRARKYARRAAPRQRGSSEA